MMSCGIIETSVKDNINVEEMFRSVTSLVLNAKKVVISIVLDFYLFFIEFKYLRACRTRRTGWRTPRRST